MSAKLKISIVPDQLTYMTSLSLAYIDSQVCCGIIYVLLVYLIFNNDLLSYIWQAPAVVKKLVQGQRVAWDSTSITSSTPYISSTTSQLQPPSTSSTTHSTPYPQTKGPPATEGLFRDPKGRFVVVVEMPLISDSGHDSDHPSSSVVGDKRGRDDEEEGEQEDGVKSVSICVG